jgi:putative tryptophan/tyrosine transport system substrate-binding protein
MRRRQFITVLGGAMAAAQLGWPRLASAQLATDLPRVGFIYTGSRAAAASRVEAMVRGLREAGFESPTQVEIVIRYTDGDPALIAPMIEEVLTKNVNVFVANGPAVLQVARKLPGGVPVVAIDLESDPVASGVAASLAHPGGNVTGVFMDFPDFSTKMLELLLESNVRLSRLAVLWDPVTGQLQLETVKAAAGAKKIGVNTFKVHRAFDFESTFDAANQDHADAVIMLSSPLFASNVQILTDSPSSIGFQPSHCSQISRGPAAWWRMGRISSTCFGCSEILVAKCCTAQNPPICRSNDQQNLSLCSTCEPPRH